MKYLLILITFLFGSSLMVNAQNGGAKFKFSSETHDFGNLKEGEEAKVEFVFRNTGNEPLIITNCSAECGCTTPSWDRSPILPGATGKIIVAYDTKGKNGGFLKKVYIQSNAAPQAPGRERYEIQIKGTVTPKN